MTTTGTASWGIPAGGRWKSSPARAGGRLLGRWPGAQNRAGPRPRCGVGRLQFRGPRLDFDGPVSFGLGAMSGLALRPRWSLHVLQSYEWHGRSCEGILFQQHRPRYPRKDGARFEQGARKVGCVWWGVPSPISGGVGVAGMVYSVVECSVV